MIVRETVSKMTYRLSEISPSASLGALKLKKSVSIRESPNGGTLGTFGGEVNPDSFKIVHFVLKFQNNLH